MATHYLIGVIGAAGAGLLALDGLLSGGPRFEELDINRDGQLSRGEFARAYPDLGSAVFLAVDMDLDGTVDESEHAAGVTAGLIARRDPR